MDPSTQRSTVQQPAAYFGGLELKLGLFRSLQCQDADRPSTDRQDKGGRCTYYRQLANNRETWVVSVSSTGGAILAQ